MGLARGCCTAGLAVGVVPLSILVAVFLETPSVIEFDEDSFAKAAAAAALQQDVPAAEVASPAEGESHFGVAEGGGGFGSGSMFDRIASVYDSTNKLMSFGLDHTWRTALVKDCLQLQKSDHVLDLATGTADVSLLVGSTLRELGAEAQKQVVTGLDPSVEMLRHGVSKVADRGLDGMITLVKGDAQDLTTVQSVDAKGTTGEPMEGLPTASVDKISMSFGIRNVPDRAKAFREMKRVLRPSSNSRVCILEFSLPTGDAFLSKVAKFFISQVVPFIGRIATMNSGSKEYEYLERSILKFPQPRDFAASMAREGLRPRSITSFAYGAVHLYSATPEGVAP